MISWSFKGDGMLEDNGTFKIDVGESHSKLKKIHKDVVKNIENIKIIQVSNDEELQSSALLSLLKTIKQSKPDISIPLVDDQDVNIAGLGKFIIMDKNNIET